MQKLEQLMKSIIEPPRVNFKNSIYKEKSHLLFFEQYSFNVYCFDKVQLNCLYFQNKNKNNLTPTIIYVHSFASCKYEGVFLLEHCAKNNINLCLFDARGCGESQGGQISFGFNERIDLLFVMLKLNFEFKCSRFILWGRSIGCTSILQLYQTLISHESQFLNKIFEKRLEMLKQRNNNIKFQRSSSQKKSLKLPENFNKFIYKYFKFFVLYNLPKSYHQYELFDIQFIMEGIVLDSPYTSIDDIIDDNVQRFIPFLPKIVSGPVKLYFKNYVEKNIQIDLNKRQNKDLIQLINLNAVLIISDQDELIPLERFKSLIQNYAQKFPQKNKLYVQNTKQTHRVRRPVDLIKNSILKILQNRTNVSVYIFKHIQNVKIDPDFVAKFVSHVEPGVKQIQNTQDKVDNRSSDLFYSNLDQINVQGIMDNLQMKEDQSTEESHISLEQNMLPQKGTPQKQIELQNAPQSQINYSNFNSQRHQRRNRSSGLNQQAVSNRYVQHNVANPPQRRVNGSFYQDLSFPSKDKYNVFQKKTTTKIVEEISSPLKKNYMGPKKIQSFREMIQKHVIPHLNQLDFQKAQENTKDSIQQLVIKIHI